MIKVNFKTLIPNPVKNWIYEKDFEDPLLEAEKRLGWKFNTIEEFKSNGTIYSIEISEEKEMVGDCSIVIEVEDEVEGRKEFNKIFNTIAKRGQKFKITSFIKI